jgi:hypothetical protein
MPRESGFIWIDGSRGARLPTSGGKTAGDGAPAPALSGLEEFDGDLFAFDVGQLVRTEQNRKGFCRR